MYSTYLKNKVGSLFLMLSLVSGITSQRRAAQAQDRSVRDRRYVPIGTAAIGIGTDHNRNDDNRYRNQNDRLAGGITIDTATIIIGTGRRQVIQPRPRVVYVPRNGNYGGMVATAVW